MKDGVVGFLVFILITVWVGYCNHAFKKEHDRYTTRVGEKVVLSGDTLMIIDYSFVNSNFTLEDGRKISIEILDDIVVNEKEKTDSK